MNLRPIIQKLLTDVRHRRPQRIKAAFMVFSICCLMVACENDIAKIKTFAVSEDLPRVTAEGFEMLLSDSTVIRSKLQTPELIRRDNEREPYTEFPKGVKITQYDAGMKVVSYITAEYAKYYEANERWEAKNNVIAINLNGDTLKTEYLIWDKKKQRIYSKEFVKIIQKDQIYTGTGFESNQDFTEYSFKNLKGQMYVDVQE